MLKFEGERDVDKLRENGRERNRWIYPTIYLTLLCYISHIYVSSDMRFTDADVERSNIINIDIQY